MIWLIIFFSSLNAQYRYKTGAGKFMFRRRMTGMPIFEVLQNQKSKIQLDTWQLHLDSLQYQWTYIYVVAFGLIFHFNSVKSVTLTSLLFAFNIVRALEPLMIFVILCDTWENFENEFARACFLAYVRLSTNFGSTMACCRKLKHIFSTSYISFYSRT